MVQGLPAVDWKKPENNAKLFAAVLALIPGTPDYKKIAAVFGESFLIVTSSKATIVINYHIATALGLNFHKTKTIGTADGICYIGPNVPANAISYRLNVVRKEGVALGLSPGSGSFSTPTKINRAAKRAVPAATNNMLKGMGRKRGGMLSDGPSDDPDVAMNSEEEETAAETDDEKIPATPIPSVKRQKTVNGRVSKRISPRKGKKTDYKKLDDPFATMDNAKDENGNNVFGEPSGTE
ncbi:hypothetical protein HO133_003764 [Letharia lupina]|uniref:Uncharacterized protein n=1 Tax=Letharia lupina TaxID=560253 RepID=A0A8H6CAY6_9LECA|nr:uncharacterized protein HO133_003764 [Letharia lupina]KAF6219939.1 hypothetical protein HO133_003764 [Letharia lupina]